MNSIYRESADPQAEAEKRFFESEESQDPRDIAARKNAMHFKAWLESRRRQQLSQNSDRQSYDSDLEEAA